MIRLILMISKQMMNINKIVNQSKILLFFSLLCLFASPLQAEAPTTRYTITIDSPSDSETFQNDVQSLPVTVSVNPTLKTGDMITVLVDGNQAVVPTQDLTINLPWMPRGSHTIQAKIIQKDGPGAESELITIFQHRTNLNSPRGAGR